MLLSPSPFITEQRPMNSLRGAVNVNIHILHPLQPPLFLRRRPPLPTILTLKPSSLRPCQITACASHPGSSAATSEIDMVKTRDGFYTATPDKVVVLWDLDNKPPRGPPYEAALALKKVAQQFGELVDVSAYANRHAFIHLPKWVQEERRERRHMDILERKGVVTPPEPYVCGVCGRKCKTNLDLKKHFKQLHERERQKKLNRLNSLKGKKKKRFKERFIDGNDKYREAARTLVRPKTGYGLAGELRRAGVFVKMVADKPQAADQAVKRQMEHSLTRGIDWLVLVSDDSDFATMLMKARNSNLGTVVVGDWDRALGKHADLWVPWTGVENGEVAGEDLLAMVQKGGNSMEMEDDETVSVMEFGGQENLEEVMDELVGNRTNHWRVEEEEGSAMFQIRQFLDEVDEDDDFLSDGDAEEEDDDLYI